MSHRQPSSLLALPTELRLFVLEHVLLGHRSLQLSVSWDTSSDRLCAVHPDSGLGLLTTNKQLSAEFLSILHKKAVFSFEILGHWSAELLGFHTTLRTLTAAQRTTFSMSLKHFRHVRIAPWLSDLQLGRDQLQVLLRDICDVHELPGRTIKVDFDQLVWHGPWLTGILNILKSYCGTSTTISIQAHYIDEEAREVMRRFCQDFRFDFFEAGDDEPER